MCLLHADIEPAHEGAVAAVLRARGYDVSCSHEVSPEMREVERTVTTVVNAALRPPPPGLPPGPRRGRRRGARHDLVGRPAAGGGGGGAAGRAAPVGTGRRRAGGGGGAAVANGFADAVTFDMGGTSTDVCLILDGAPAPAAEREVAGFTVRFPSLDVHTIGAGGGLDRRHRPGRGAGRSARRARAPTPVPPATAGVGTGPR